ncbi:hypothetical protein GCM10010377_30420 [Streptomyces viridiviolaceus]|nr:hypothetical protein GCM10010377_30420 [Streptomyces viridiviolaceus]
MLKTSRLEYRGNVRDVMVVPRRNGQRVPAGDGDRATGGTHMFAVMDLGTRIAVFVTIAAVVGSAVVALRWFGAQRR